MTKEEVPYAIIFTMWLVGTFFDGLAGMMVR